MKNKTNMKGKKLSKKDSFIQYAQNAFNYDLAQSIVKQESRRKKRYICTAAFLSSLICIIFAVLYLHRLRSVEVIQDINESTLFEAGMVAYDVGCYS